MDSFEFWKLIPEGKVILGADISIKSSGIWVIDRSGPKYIGTYKLNNRPQDTDTDLVTRLGNHFRNKIKEHSVTDIVYEDIFQGVNAKNNRTFSILNTVFEQIKLKYTFEFTMERMVNTQWKSDLREIALQNTGELVKYYANHKENTCRVLNVLGFNFKCEVPDDITDCFAMLMVYCCKKFGNYGSLNPKLDKQEGFSVGRAEGYHKLFTTQGYVVDDLAEYPSNLLVEDTEYKIDLDKTILKFYEGYNANCILVVNVGSYRNLGFDLRKFDVVQELNGIDNVAVIVCKKNCVSTKLKSLKISRRFE